MKLMYLSGGAMHFYDGARTHEIPSQRVEHYAQTLRQLERQNAWKTEGEGARFMGQYNPYLNASEHLRGSVTGVAARESHVLYAVDLAGETGGVYSKDPLNPEAEEGLITSAVRFHARDLHICGDALYFALGQGVERHIARMDAESGRYDVLTEGDTDERRPWPSPDGSVICYDVCGYARDSEQRLLGCGPRAIVSLDARTGEVQELFSAEDREYLRYTESADGVRRMLVRPYKPNRGGGNPLGCLLAPLGAISGFIHFFNSFNEMRKGKRPQVQAGNGEAARTPEEKLVVDGVVIDPKQLARERRGDDPYAGLIPQDWQLVEIQPDGAQTVLRGGVLDYLPLPDGGYLYSNGAHVFQVDAAGERRMLFKAHIATDFALIAE